jgi:hypothetical protein
VVGIAGRVVARKAVWRESVVEIRAELGFSAGHAARQASKTSMGTPRGIETVGR